MFCYLFLDSDWIKYICINLVVFVLELLLKNDFMICFNKDFIYVGNDLCYFFKNGNFGGFVGLGCIFLKVLWVWWVGKKEYRLIILCLIN